MFSFSTIVWKESGGEGSRVLLSYRKREGAGAGRRHENGGNPFYHRTSTDQAPVHL